METYRVICVLSDVIIMIEGLLKVNFLIEIFIIDFKYSYLTNEKRNNTVNYLFFYLHLTLRLVNFFVCKSILLET